MQFGGIVDIKHYLMLTQQWGGIGRRNRTCAIKQTGAIIVYLLLLIKSYNLKKLDEFGRWWSLQKIKYAQALYEIE